MPPHAEPPASPAVLLHVVQDGDRVVHTDPVAPDPERDGQRYRLIVCGSGSCRKAKGYPQLLDLAHAVPHSSISGCQEVCSGPVVGLVRSGGTVRWYRRVNGERLRRLALVVRAGEPRRSLRDSEVRKRRGLIRHPGKIRPLR